MSRIAISAAISAVFLAPMPVYAESDIVGSWKQTAFYQKASAVVLGAEEGVRALPFAARTRREERRAARAACPHRRGD